MDQDGWEMAVNNLRGLINDRVSIGGHRTIKKGRSRWELIKDILKATSEERKSKKTRIMQKAYLDWRNFNRYFDVMLNDGFIVKCNPDEDYMLTDKGKDLLKRLKDVDEMLC